MKIGVIDMRPQWIVDFQDALVKIAYGRTDNGRALSGRQSQTLARDVLEKHGLDWSAEGRKP